MRDDVTLHLNEEQAGLIMWLTASIDWTNETIGHIAEGLFTELADQGIEPMPEDLATSMASCRLVECRLLALERKIARHIGASHAEPDLRE